MRVATDSDWPHIWGCMKEFAIFAELPYSLDEQDCKSVILDLMKHSYVAVNDGGFICGIITESPLNKNWIIAKEFLWWSSRGKGLELFYGFRHWAIEHGADELQMSSPPNEKVERFYKTFGPQSEVVYSEALKCA